MQHTQLLKFIPSDSSGDGIECEASPETGMIEIVLVTPLKDGKATVVEIHLNTDEALTLATTVIELVERINLADEVLKLL